MMRNFFSIDNPVFQAISRLGDLFILSFFWILTSLPLITIGASTTALLDVTLRILRKRDSGIAKDYFKAFKNNFRQSTIIWLIMAAAGTVLAFDIIYWSEQSGSAARTIGAVSIGVAILYSALLLYVFAVQAVFVNTVKATFRTAFLLSLKHWPTTIMLLLTCGGVYYVCLKYPIALYLMAFVGIGAFAMIFSVRYLTIFRKYNSALDPLADEGNNEPILQLNNKKGKGKNENAKLQYGKSKVIK